MISMLEGILNRPKTVFSLMLVLITAGVLAYRSIPKEAAPDIDIPIFYISISQQGISPEDAERLIARPMETELRGLEGLKEITAITTEGHAGILLEYDVNFDKDLALNEVREKVDQAKVKIPENADEPSVNSINMALQPTINISLSGNVPERTLYQISRRLKDVIEAIPSVKEAALSGHREELLEVIIDTQKMESYSVTQTELVNALALNNQLIPAGFMDSGKGRFNIKVPGLVETADDVFSLPLKQSGESVVTLGDIATIKRTFKDRTKSLIVNGQPAIGLEVVKRIGENIIENNQAVRAAVEQVTRDLPETIHVTYMLDQSDNIKEILASLQSSILTAIFLVMILVVATLGLKSGLLVGLSIPTSFLIGFLILSFIGMTVNTMVMFGLVLTVGMLVDGAIVMVEYADRKAAEGMPPRAAYIRASKLMFWPIVSSTATTLAAFLPMLLWPGVSGKFMSYLPVMVIIVLSASLITAMIFLPVTGGVLSSASSFLAKYGEFILTGATSLFLILALAGNPALKDSIGSYPALTLGIIAGLLVCFPLYKLFKAVFSYTRARLSKSRASKNEKAQVFSGQEKFDPQQLTGFMGIYIRTLRVLVTNPLGTFATMGGMLLICCGIFVLFIGKNNGTEFFVAEEPEIANLFVSARGNMSSKESVELVNEVNSIVMNISGIQNITAKAFPSGAGGGTGGQDKPADLIGQITMEFADYCCRRKGEEIFQEIRNKTANLAGIKVEVRGVEGGPPTGKDIQLQVASNNYDELSGIVTRVRKHLDSMEGLLDQEDSRPLPGIEWVINIDRTNAARYKADIAPAGTMIQLVTNGVLIGEYRPSDSEDEVEIRVRLPQEERTLDRFEQLRLQTPLGQIPMSNFIEQVPQQKVSSIVRRDGQYIMDIKATVDKSNGYLVTTKVKELQNWIDSQEWPETVSLTFRGADEEQKEAQDFLQKAMLGSLFLMFLILLTQFNSFYQSFLTLSTVVMSVFGVLLGILITGQKFSIIMTGTGIVALAGIVVNNAIVLIDTYNRLRSEGEDPIDAILKTSAQRIRPVLLTTITTIAGLIPMATQVSFDFVDRVTTYGSVTSTWWVQLSTAIIAGLTFSTILTLVVIPTMLAAPRVYAQFFTRLIHRIRTGRDGSPPPDGGGFITTVDEHVHHRKQVAVAAE
ncbi:efflux RND transporter permease subunit [Flexibacterium corallicola]|uniref:efflux RND transporter permease subunit n=1 Tax=Flexibacterium corallicola TaxID=3037259 RepID=UPI00286EC24B|nr:efflux RND transporter permease subunit [Pseudovibrio sp. M1P-2-3]